MTFRDTEEREQPKIPTAASYRNILRMWHEWEITGHQRVITLVVETDLELRPGLDGFDPQALEGLMCVAEEHFRASPSAIDRIRIVPAG